MGWDYCDLSGGADSCLTSAKRRVENSEQQAGAALRGANLVLRHGAGPDGDVSLLALGNFPAPLYSCREENLHYVSAQPRRWGRGSLFIRKWGLVHTPPGGLSARRRHAWS